MPGCGGKTPDYTRYNDRVITRGIREFIARDWRAARESKDAYWGDRIARLGPQEGLSGVSVPVIDPEDLTSGCVFQQSASAS